VPVVVVVAPDVVGSLGSAGSRRFPAGTVELANGVDGVPDVTGDVTGDPTAVSV
jgi:hypothetical protein